MVEQSSLSIFNFVKFSVLLLSFQIEMMSRMMANIVLQPATSNPNVPSQHNDINVPPSVLNQGLGNVPSSQQDNINIPPSVLNLGIGNMPPSQHNNINIPPSVLNQGLGNVPSSQHNDINMPSSSLNQGIGNMPPSQHNNINVPSSLLNQGIGNMPSSQRDMPSSSLNQGIGNMPSSQHNNINMPSSSLNQGVGCYGAQPPGIVGETSGGGNPLRSLPVHAEYSDKPMIEELAAASLEELTTLALAGKPMWVNGSHNAEVLNEREYFRAFPRGLGPRPLGFKSESSRESMVINMNHINLIEILMDLVSDVVPNNSQNAY